MLRSADASYISQPPSPLGQARAAERAASALHAVCAVPRVHPPLPMAQPVVQEALDLDAVPVFLLTQTTWVEQDVLYTSHNSLLHAELVASRGNIIIGTSTTMRE